jgi:hypothetical protein
MTPSFSPFQRPSSSAGRPPKPAPFHMSEPVLDRGIWYFCVTADEEILRFVMHLPCVMSYTHSPFLRQTTRRVTVGINPRYDHEEAWLWIYDLLEGETRFVELDESWENAIESACGDEDEADWG